MNSPQSLLPEQKFQGRSRFKVAVFCVITVHVVGLLALLLQGCKREQPAPPEPQVQMDTNPPPPIVDTNPVAPFVDTAPPMPPPAVAQEHVIVQGDILSNIARKYGVTVKALKEANPTVDEKKLQIGHKLVIPVPSATTATVSSPGAVTDAGGQTYTVKSGDNLIKIATQFGTTAKAIQDANNLTTTKIVVGQKLKIPEKSGSPAAQ